MFRCRGPHHRFLSASGLADDVLIRARVPSAEAGQCVSFALKRVRRTDVRKGMVLVHKTETLPKGDAFPMHVCGWCAHQDRAAVRQFEGQVLIL